MYAAANIHEILKVRAALQAIAQTPNSGISLQNKSYLNGEPHNSLRHSRRDLRFLPPRKVYNVSDNTELGALQSVIARHLQLEAQDVQFDNEMLGLIYQWHRVTLNGIVIGSRSSKYTRRAVSRENFFVRIRYKNHGRNTLYTYKDTYTEILHYLEVSPLPDVPPLMLAYVQHYDVLLSSNLVEQRNQSGAPVHVHAGNIRS